MEYFGPGMQSLSVADRATVANMTPEYGATLGFFPVDAKTIDYLRNTGRKAQADLTEAYAMETGFFYSGAEEPEYTETIYPRPCHDRPIPVGPGPPPGPD